MLNNVYFSIDPSSVINVVIIDQPTYTVCGESVPVRLIIYQCYCMKTVILSKYDGYNGRVFYEISCTLEEFCSYCDDSDLRFCDDNLSGAQCQ